MFYFIIFIKYKLENKPWLQDDASIPSKNKGVGIALVGDNFLCGVFFWSDGECIVTYLFFVMRGR